MSIIGNDVRIAWLLGMTRISIVSSRASQLSALPSVHSQQPIRECLIVKPSARCSSPNPILLIARLNSDYSIPLGRCRGEAGEPCASHVPYRCAWSSLMPHGPSFFRRPWRNGGPRRRRGGVIGSPPVPTRMDIAEAEEARGGGDRGFREIVLLFARSVESRGSGRVGKSSFGSLSSYRHICLESPYKRVFRHLCLLFSSRAEGFAYL